MDHTPRFFDLSRLGWCGILLPVYCRAAHLTYNHATMVKPLLLASLLLLNVFAAVTERKVIVPANAAKPVGPYSPGISAGDYLYVSGQGIRDAQNNVPVGVAAQAKQCLENVKAIVEAGGLTLEHVVHMQLYLERLSDLPEVERVYASYFPNNPPARVILGTAKMPTDTPIEMTAVAVRDLKAKRVLKLKTLTPLGHASAAMAVGNRLYLSGLYGATPAAVQQKLKQTLAEVKATEVWRNEYGTKISAPIAMKCLARRRTSSAFGDCLAQCHRQTTNAKWLRSGWRNDLLSGAGHVRVRRSGFARRSARRVQTIANRPGQTRGDVGASCRDQCLSQ